MQDEEDEAPQKRGSQSVRRSRAKTAAASGSQGVDKRAEARERKKQEAEEKRRKQVRVL